MTVTRSISALTGLSLLLLVSSTSRAQTAQRVSAQASGIFVTLGGDAYEGLDNGPGLEAQFRFNPGALSIGGGFQLSTHGIQTTTLDGDIKLLGPFVEPRYVIAVQSSRAAPYVSSRIAYLRQTLDVEGFDGHANGVQFNGGGGVILRLATNVNVDLGATFGYIDFGRATLKDKTTGVESETEDSDSGTNWVVRIGFAFGLGR
jgi:hypothetical protein